MGMRSKIGAGVVAGLLAGVAFGLAAHLISVPMAMGGRMSMIEMMARVVRSESLVAGWIYLMVNSLLAGGIFGLLLGSRAARLVGGLAWGALYGVVLWILGALVLMPPLLGMEVFSPVTTPSLRSSTSASLGAHVLSGLILGATFSGLYRGRPRDR